MVEATVVANRGAASSAPFLAVSLVALAAVGAGCGREPKVVAPPPPDVSVSQPVEEPVQETLEFTGRVSAVQSVEVRARVTGYITKLAQLDLARLDLEFTRVTAPIAGRVSRAEITQGNLVVVGASGGPLLTTVVSLDPVHVNFDTDERALVRIRKANIARDGAVTPENIRAAQAPVFVALAEQNDFPYRGTVDFIDNQIDPSTGTIHVWAVLPNTDRLLAPGMFVRVRVPISEPRPGVLVTDRAIGTDQDRKYVLVVNDKNVVEYRPVKLGPLQNALRAVTDGLAPGEWVIVNGIQRARPGGPVTPQKVSMRPGPPAEAPS